MNSGAETVASPRIESSELLLESQNDYPDFDKIKSLIERGADINTSNTRNVSVLMNICHNSTMNTSTLLSIIHLLIESGVNINAKDFTDRDAFLIACSFSKRIEILELLLKSGANINTSNQSGIALSSLLFWFQDGDENVLKFMIDHGADVNAKTKNGTTILQSYIHTAHKVKKSVITLLLANGANPNDSDNNDWTALMSCCVRDNNDKDIIRLLINYGANINAVNKKEQSAIMIACDREAVDFDVVKILIENGADISKIKFRNSFDISIFCRLTNEIKLENEIKQLREELDHCKKFLRFYTRGSYDENMIFE